MATKKYIVRDGFVVVQTITKNDGSAYDRTYTSGEEVTFDDAQAALHAHKLEFASAKDREAALAVEQQAKVASAAAGSPVELVTTLVAALQAAMSAGQAGAAVAPSAPAA